MLPRPLHLMEPRNGQAAVLKDFKRGLTQYAIIGTLAFARVTLVVSVGVTMSVVNVAGLTGPWIIANALLLSPSNAVDIC